MTSQEMMKHQCTASYWLVNVAPLGASPDWQEQIQPHQEQKGLLFGYEQSAFLAKQYK